MTQGLFLLASQRIALYVRPRPPPPHPRADGQAGRQAQEDNDALRHVEDVEAGQQLVLGALVVRDGFRVLAALEGLVGEKLDCFPVEQSVRCSGALQMALDPCISPPRRTCASPGCKPSRVMVGTISRGITFALSRRFMSERNCPLHSVRYTVNCAQIDEALACQNSVRAPHEA